MKFKTGIHTIEFEVIDHTPAEENTYTFADIKSATRWIKELIEDFETDARMICGYEREYDEFGNLLRSDNFF